MTDKNRKLIEEWLQPCAVVPIETATVQILLNALRERLAQPEPPVLTGIDCSCGKKWRILNNTLTASEPETVMAAYKHQTYAAYKTDGEMKIGVVPEQEQKPVAWMIWTQGPVSTFLKKYEAESEFDRLNRQYPEPSRKLIALYTTPPRQWVGLTEEEIRKCFFRDDAPPSSPPYWWEYRNPDYTAIYALIDQALKEKNT